MIIRQAVEMQEGAGVTVRRLFPVANNRYFDPFVLFDHFMIGNGAGFPPHPHRGFEGITYVLAGSMEHRDNLGNHTRVQAGGLQRFTAGRGIEHSEMPDPALPTHGIQLWVNLPQRLKGLEPSYQQIDPEQIHELEIDGGYFRELSGPSSPMQLNTPVCYGHIVLAKDSQFKRDCQDHERTLIYMLVGQAEINGHIVNEGFAVFLESENLSLKCLQDSQFILLQASPYNEPIRQWGPFVD